MTANDDAEMAAAAVGIVAAWAIVAWWLLPSVPVIFEQVVLGLTAAASLIGATRRRPKVPRIWWLAFLAISVIGLVLTGAA